MKKVIRAGSAHIFGYVNVTEKKSRPVMTPHGRAVEEIELIIKSAYTLPKTRVLLLLGHPADN